MTRGIAIFSLLLAASSLAACGDDEGKSGSVGGEPTASESITDEPTDSGDRPDLVLHDAGAEPRSLLRVQPVEGSSEHATMTMTMGMAITLDGERQPTQEIPPMEVGMLVEITEVADNGDVTSRFEYDETDVVGGGPAVAQMEASLAQLEGVEGTLEMTSTGDFIDSEIDVPAGVDPLLRSTLDSFESQIANLCPPVPDEAVGIGASWTARTTTTLNGIEADAVYEYTVVELDDDSIALDVSYETTAGEQDVEAPGLPPGSTLHLESMETSGEGRVTIEPGRLFPVVSEAEGGGTVRMTAEGDGQRTEMVQELELDMELRAD